MSESEMDLMDKALKADFPPEALSQDVSRGFALTSIKAAYIVERLNDVFGIFGWSYTFAPFEMIGEEICTIVHLQISVGDLTRTISQSGGKKPATKGGCPMTDARKSAITDGLTKCASVLGIGHRIFKGQQDATPSNAPKDTGSQPKQSPGGAQGATGGAKTLCPECGADAIIKSKEEYGGGWLCYKKKGGCGAKFQDDPASGDATPDSNAPKMHAAFGEMGITEREDRLDYVNEVLKANGQPPVKSSKDLTREQENEVIGKLIDDKKLKDAMKNEAPEEQTDMEPF
jgi:hypothetical protein